MKKCYMVFALFCLLITVSSVLVCVVPTNAATPAERTLTGARKISSISLADGVLYSKYNGKAYGASSNLQFDVIEADMSTQNLYLSTVYGKGNCDHPKMSDLNAIKSFQSANPTLTPVAAINADLWWTSTRSRTEPANNNQKLFSDKGTFVSSLGFTMSCGEVFTSDKMSQENFASYENYVAFGITSDNVPVISNPDVEVTINNTTKNMQVIADGVNRLPAYDSLVMYTDRGPSQSYCNDDAFEVKIKITSTPDYVIKHGTKISGAVEMVSPKNTARPTMSLNSNYIILTARGAKYDQLSSYKKGDKVEIDVCIFDRDGKYTKEWQKVTDAISGHLRYATDGKYTTNDVAVTVGYPATLIGITKSGNVVMVTYGQDTEGTSRKGIANSGIVQFCNDFDLKDGFVLDGGGSAHMYVKNGNSFTFANHPTEPNRQLLNLMVLSTGPKKTTQKTVPTAPARDKNLTTLDFSKEANLWFITDQTPVTGKGNNINFRYDETQKALKLSALTGKDPYIDISYSSSSPKVSAAKHKYVTIEYMLPTTNSSSAIKGNIYLGTKKISDTPNMIRDGKYHTMTIDMSDKTDWKGTINELRYDFFNKSEPGDIIYIKSIKISESNPNPTTTDKVTEAPIETIIPSNTDEITVTPTEIIAPLTTSPMHTVAPTLIDNETGDDITNSHLKTPANENDNLSDYISDTEQITEDGNEDGMSVGVIICIIAGVVLVSATSVIAVILIKKKKS